jgi:tetratricopeptide (TPR) repeat protein
MRGFTWSESTLGWRAIVLAIALAVAACGPKPDPFAARMEAIAALQEERNFEGTIEELRTILDLAPDHPEANYRMGLALLATGSSSRAVWPLQRAAGTEEFGVPAGNALARSLLASQSPEDAIRVATDVLEIEADNPGALQVRALASLRSSRPEPALADAEQLAMSDEHRVAGL